MRSLSSAELLQVWEECGKESPVQGELQLLSLAYAFPDLATAAKLSIGERDASLLQLRERMFGSKLHNLAQCPQCNQSLEWETQVADLSLQIPRNEPEPRILDLNTGEYKIRYRLPNSEDLELASRDKTFQSNPHKLIAACILTVEGNGSEGKAEALPEQVFEVLSQKMEEADPQANIRMQLTCPACTHNWEADFDIVTYFWAEIDDWARRTLQEIFLLAHAFGWTEAEILALSPRRRHLYLEMLNA